MKIINVIKLENIYQGHLCITQKKEKGLMTLCNKDPPSIPEPFHSFYRSLPSTEGSVLADDDINYNSSSDES